MNRKPQGTSIVLGLIAGLAGGVVSSLFLVGTPVFAEKAFQEPKVIKAEKFEIIDKNGRLRGEFGLRSDGTPILRLYDEDGNPRVGFSPKSDEGQIGSVR
jgi:hypothetical protein